VQLPFQILPFLALDLKEVSCHLWASVPSGHEILNIRKNAHTSSVIMMGTINIRTSRKHSIPSGQGPSVNFTHAGWGLKS
jgi:hypothetical protein